MKRPTLFLTLLLLLLVTITACTRSAATPPPPTPTLAAPPELAFPTPVGSPQGKAGTAAAPQSGSQGGATTPTTPPPTATPVPPTETPVPPTPTAEPTTKPPTEDLVNRTWFLQTITKGRAAPQPILQGSTITIFFDANGTFYGSGGCNNYTGTWAAGDDGSMALTIGQMTNMICDDPPGVMEQEQDYMAALPRTQSFAIGDDGSLSLYTSDQQILNYTLTQ